MRRYYYDNAGEKHRSYKDAEASNKRLSKNSSGTSSIIVTIFLILLLVFGSRSVYASFPAPPPELKSLITIIKWCIVFLIFYQVYMLVIRFSRR